MDESQPVVSQRMRRETRRYVLFVSLGISLVSAIVSGAYVINLANRFIGQTHKIANAFPEESTRPTKAGVGSEA